MDCGGIGNAMTFTTGVSSRCAGGNHYEIPVTVNGNTRTLHFTAQEIADVAEIEDFQEFRRRVLGRLVSAIREADVVTLPQMAAAINNKTFEV
jgi:hypothetical protein